MEPWVVYQIVPDTILLIVFRTWFAVMGFVRLEKIVLKIILAVRITLVMSRHA